MYDELELGEKVTLSKTKSFNFNGLVIGKFKRRRGTLMYSVENKDGIVMVFNRSQLKRWVKEKPKVMSAQELYEALNAPTDIGGGVEASFTTGTTTL